MASKQNLLAKRALRAPFVITVTGAGMLFGTTGCDSDASSNPPAAECPETEPSASSSCENGQVCRYGDCGGQPTKTYTCKSERWEVMEMSCNPPPPQCPEETPAAGSSCSYWGSACTYGDCNGDPTITADCKDDTWVVTERTCNPPAPLCPEAVPEGACDQPGQQCQYGDCYGEPTTTAECNDEGQWEIAERSCNPPAPQCPETVPEGACDQPGQQCHYGDCDGQPTTTAQCTDGQWEVAERSCNPPAPLCPEAAPTEGSACELPGQQCQHGDCNGEPHIFSQCTDGQWVVAERSCNPPPPEL